MYSESKLVVAHYLWRALATFRERKKKTKPEGMYLKEV